MIDLKAQSFMLQVSLWGRNWLFGVSLQRLGDRASDDALGERAEIKVTARTMSMDPCASSARPVRASCGTAWMHVATREAAWDSGVCILLCPRVAVGLSLRAGIPPGGATGVAGGWSRRGHLGGHHDAIPPPPGPGTGNHEGEAAARLPGVPRALPAISGRGGQGLQGFGVQVEPLCRALSPGKGETEQVSGRWASGSTAGCRAAVRIPWCWQVLQCK